MSQPAIMRDCRVYEFEVLDPNTNYQTKTVGYIGETAREPLARLLEHVYAQPWSDTITLWRVLDEVYPNKPAVLAAEKAEIRARRPLFNYEENLDNPRRIPIPEARRQRAARDAAKGAVTPWQAPTDARPARESVKVAKPTRRRARRCPRPVRRLGVAAGVWVPLMFLAWTGAWRAGLGAWLGLRAGALAAVVLVLVGWWLFPKRSWDTKAAGVVAAGAALLLLGTVAPALGHHLPAPRPAQQQTRR